ncbi:MAG: ABC transporter [Proteobacteria bacterium]|nr:MAG: ABC transporter [Pseudomonadota bacterium]PIE40482.1 MAG: ABC transporter [Gammaproteobacteria bacterium]
MIDLQGYGPSIFEGAILTIELAVLSLAIAVFLGLLTASAKLSHNPLLRGVGSAYTTLIRGVPDLVLMLLFFYGGQMLINSATDAFYDRYESYFAHLFSGSEAGNAEQFSPHFQFFFDWLKDWYEDDFFINVNEFIAGVTTIGFIFGAYMGETFRGAFLAVEKGQIEAGVAYGMTSWQRFHRILFPQMMRHALPGIANNWQVLLKTTALVSILGLQDMVRLASEAAKATHQPFTFLLPVAVGYLLMSAVSESGFSLLNRKYSVGVEKG